MVWLLYCTKKLINGIAGMCVVYCYYYKYEYVSYVVLPQC
jgi:hypothetical protein